VIPSDLEGVQGMGYCGVGFFVGKYCLRKSAGHFLCAGYEIFQIFV
jgi:hypothetical protein